MTLLFKKKNSLSKNQEKESTKLIRELKNIHTIDLISNSSNFLEKILWFCIAIIGILWLVDIIWVVIQDENPKITRNEYINLPEMKYPAMTLCYDGFTKYGIAERLGNYFDPNFPLPNEFKDILKKIIDRTLNFKLTDIENSEYGSYDYMKECPSLKTPWCKVVI